MPSRGKKQPLKMNMMLRGLMAEKKVHVPLYPSDCICLTRQGRKPITSDRAQTSNREPAVGHLPEMRA